MKVAVVQMSSGTVVGDNLRAADDGIGQAAAAEASLVALPENFALMACHHEQRLKHAEPLGDGPIQAFCADAARRHGIWLVAGSIALKTTTDRVASTCLVFNPDGVVAGQYQKMHLFDVDIDADSSDGQEPSAGRGESHRESQHFVPGQAVCTVDLGKIMLQPVICYDLRFPELMRSSDTDTPSAQIIAVPSAFTHLTGRAHWKTLVCARAIENLAFVLAPNQTGYHGSSAQGRRTWGHSLIVDYWGRILASAADQPQVITAELDLEAQARQREQFPALNHRRIFSLMNQATR